MGKNDSKMIVKKELFELIKAKKSGRKYDLAVTKFRVSNCTGTIPGLHQVNGINVPGVSPGRLRFS